MLVDTGKVHVRVNRLDAYLSMCGPDDKFADRNRAALGKEGTDPQVRVYPFNRGGIDLPVEVCCYGAIIYALADQRQGCRPFRLGLGNGLGFDGA